MGQNVKIIAVSSILAFYLLNAWAEAQFKFNGDLEYRLRYHFVKSSTIKGKDSVAVPDYTNRYAWNLLAKVTVSENLMFGIRMSNPSGSGTENIADNVKSVSENNYTIVSLPEMYFKWSVGFFSLTGGIIPVPGNVILNLVTFESDKYYKVGSDLWAIRYNNSQKGLNFGFNFVKKENFSIGADILATLAVDAKGSEKADVYKLDQYRFMVFFPISLLQNNLTLLPGMHARLNIFRSSDNEVGKHAIDGGMEAQYALMNKMLVLKAGVAAGTYETDKDTIINADKKKEYVPPINPYGILVNSGIILSPGYGKASVLFDYGQSYDSRNNPVVKSNVYFWDMRYEMPIKSLTIAPRLRIWYFNNDNTDKKETWLRPELIFKAAF